MTLNKNAAALLVGKNVTLTATVSPSNATNKNVAWSSGNTAVATVSAGKIEAKAAGTAVITVKTADGNKTATCTVTVTKPTVAVTGVTLNKTTASLAAGKTEQLTATVSPSNATNKNVTWSSSNTAAATVSAGKITAQKPGTATITVETADGKKKAKCTVTVTQPVTGVTLEKTSAALRLGGKPQTLKAIIGPANATNKNVTWSSSNTGVVTVSSAGTISAVREGTATITARTADGNKTATCIVAVLPNIAPPKEVNITKADIDADVAKGKYTQEDIDYLVALADEAPNSYEKFYAVACTVRNRVKSSGFPNSYKAVVTQKDAQGRLQFGGYDEDKIGVMNDNPIRTAAAAVLRGGYSTVKNYCFFFGRINNYDLWFESTKTGGNMPIVIGTGNLRNVHHTGSGYVHNQVNTKTPDAVILYNNVTQKWYDQ